MVIADDAEFLVLLALFDVIATLGGSDANPVVLFHVRDQGVGWGGLYDNMIALANAD